MVPLYPLSADLSIGDHHSTKPIHQVSTLEQTRFICRKRECGIHEIDLGDF